MSTHTSTIRVAAAAAIGVLTLTVMSIGVATAANGGSLVLGHSNSATATTSLTDQTGTPLSLVGKKSKPPLKVNSSKEVKHLNAALLGGKTAASLATSGSGVQTPYIPTISIGLDISTDSTNASLLMSTAKLAAGTYYLTGSATGSALSGVTGCFLGTTPDLADSLQAAFVNGDSSVNVSLIAISKLKKPTVISLYCYGTQASVFRGGLLAVKVGHNAPGSLPKSAA